MYVCIFDFLFGTDFSESTKMDTIIFMTHKLHSSPENSCLWNIFHLIIQPRNKLNLLILTGDE